MKNVLTFFTYTVFFNRLFASKCDHNDGTWSQTGFAAWAI